jgi:hypothetical protein
LVSISSSLFHPFSLAFISAAGSSLRCFRRRFRDHCSRRVCSILARHPRCDLLCDGRVLRQGEPPTSSPSSETDPPETLQVFPKVYPQTQTSIIEWLERSAFPSPTLLLFLHFLSVLLPSSLPSLRTRLRRTSRLHRRLHLPHLPPLPSKRLRTFILDHDGRSSIASRCRTRSGFDASSAANGFIDDAGAELLDSRSGG